MYRLKKSLRQHSRLVGAIASVIVVLLLGIIATTIQTSRALTAERTARQAEEKMLKLADANAKLAKEKTLFAEQMSDLATGRAAFLAKANEQLGLAASGTGKSFSRTCTSYFSAAMTAAFAIGFDNDSSGPTGPKGSPLLPRDTQAWRDALDLSLIPASGRLIWRSPAMTQHDGPIRCVWPSAPMGKCSLRDPDDQTVRVWDLATGQPVQTPPALSQVNSISFASPDGKTLASGIGRQEHLPLGSEHRQTARHAVGTFPASLRGQFQSGWKVSGVWLGRQHHLSLGRGHGSTPAISSCDSGHYCECGIQSGGRSHGFGVGRWRGLPLGSDPLSFAQDAGRSHPSGRESVSFSSDGKLLASGSDDQTIRAYGILRLGKRCRHLRLSARWPASASARMAKQLLRQGYWIRPSGFGILARAKCTIHHVRTFSTGVRFGRFQPRWKVFWLPDRQITRSRFWDYGDEAN